ncbi:MAG: YigZ family protein [Chitinophagaceae bacterium]|nr:YigZ family protein [Chitinophagaceae bacterium]
MNTSKATRYKTIASPTTSAFKDRGSRFLGYTFPVRDKEDIKNRLREVKNEHPKATHHCFAYRLGTEGLDFRAADDGEPSGSAGRPILGQIDSAGCTNVLIVVVRYYGGTMLGVPGLINAYKTSAAEALAAAAWEEKWITQTIELSFDYNAMSEVLYLLKQNEAEVLRQDLQLFCTVTAAVPLPYEEQCAGQLLQIRGLQLKKI